MIGKLFSSFKRFRQQSGETKRRAFREYGLRPGCWKLMAGLLLCWSASGGALASALVLEVVQLRYRTVEQVLPVVQPLVPKPGTVSGMQSNLIIRTTPANLAEIKRVLDAIDRMPRRLMVTVRHDADASRAAEGASVAGTVSGSRARVTLPGERDSRGLVVEGGQGDDRVRAQVYGTQSLENDRNTQQLQVLEGNEAYIAVGQSVPVPNRSIARSVVGGRVLEQSVDSVDYRDILSGFYVRPRVSGDVVTLELSTQRDTPGVQRAIPGAQHDTPFAQGRGSMNVQRASSTVSGRLGEWLEVGGIVTGRAYQETGTGYRTATATSDNRRILIKVDELP